MKKPNSRKNEKKTAASESEQKAPLGREPSAPMTILELAASFWDAGRDYPTERRA